MRTRICQYTNLAIDCMIYRDADGLIEMDRRNQDGDWEPYHEYTVERTSAADETNNPDGRTMDVIRWTDGMISDLWIEAPQ